MTTQDFNCTITVNVTPKEAFTAISRVSEWWVDSVEGRAEQLNDEFTVHFGTTWVTFNVTEWIPEQKIVWLVADCNLPWNTDLNEWKGTEVRWKISTQNGSTKIDFSHIGLAALDCGNQCMNSWGGYIQQSFFKLMTEGKGLPNKF